MSSRTREVFDGKHLFQLTEDRILATVVVTIGVFLLATQRQALTPVVAFVPTLTAALGLKHLGWRSLVSASRELT